MKYEKPEVVVLAPAIEAVQYRGKGDSAFDGEPSDGAYRSDE